MSGNTVSQVTIIHLISEIVIIGGLVYYMNVRNKQQAIAIQQLQDRCAELELRLDHMDVLTQQLLRVIQDKNQIPSIPSIPRRKPTTPTNSVESRPSPIELFGSLMNVVSSISHVPTETASWSGQRIEELDDDTEEIDNEKNLDNELHSELEELEQSS